MVLLMYLCYWVLGERGRSEGETGMTLSQGRNLLFPIFICFEVKYMTRRIFVIVTHAQCLCAYWGRRYTVRARAFLLS